MGGCHGGTKWTRLGAVSWESQHRAELKVLSEEIAAILLFYSISEFVKFQDGVTNPKLCH